MNAIELLLSRGSAVRFAEPAPDEAVLDKVFRAALRAPDHGRMRPWQFKIIRGEGLNRFADLLADSLKGRKPDASEEELNRERQKALRSPMIVVAVAKIGPTEKIPEVEQVLSAGAATQNILLALHALGYGSVWKTGSAAYDNMVKARLGLQSSDQIVGFLYVGTLAGPIPDVPRPEPKEFVSEWVG
jgi:nitroreductase